MRILIVEDDGLVASGIKQGLRHFGYTVDLAASAEEAERSLKTETFDLAVVDIGLPGLDGLTCSGPWRLPATHVNVPLAPGAPSENEAV